MSSPPKNDGGTIWEAILKRLWSLHFIGRRVTFCFDILNNKFFSANHPHHCSISIYADQHQHQQVWEKDLCTKAGSEDWRRQVSEPPVLPEQQKQKAYQETVFKPPPVLPLSSRNRRPIIRRLAQQKFLSHHQFCLRNRNSGPIISFQATTCFASTAEASPILAGVF